MQQITLKPSGGGSATLFPANTYISASQGERIVFEGTPSLRSETPSGLGKLRDAELLALKVSAAATGSVSFCSCNVDAACLAKAALMLPRDVMHMQSSCIVDGLAVYQTLMRHGPLCQDWQIDATWLLVE